MVDPFPRYQPTYPDTIRLKAEFCPVCNGILLACEYGRHQQAKKWTAGLCTCPPRLQQLTIFDALANPEPLPEPLSPSPAPESALLKHLRLKVKVYQQLIDQRLQASDRRYQSCQGDKQALEEYKHWALTVNRHHIQHLKREIAETLEEIERLKS